MPTENMSSIKDFHKTSISGSKFNLNLFPIIQRHLKLDLKNHIKEIEKTREEMRKITPPNYSKFVFEF